MAATGRNIQRTATVGDDAEGRLADVTGPPTGSRAADIRRIGLGARMDQVGVVGLDWRDPPAGWRSWTALASCLERDREDSSSA